MSAVDRTKRRWGMQMKLHRKEIDEAIKVAFVISTQSCFYILHCHSKSTNDMSTLPHLLGDLVNEGRSKGWPKSGHAQRGLHVTLSIVPNENGLPAAGSRLRPREGSKRHDNIPGCKPPTESQLFGHASTTNDCNCQSHVTYPYKLQTVLFACSSTAKLCCLCPLSASQ